MCLNCARSLFQEKSSDFDRKQEFTSDFKEDRGFEDVPGIKDIAERSRTGPPHGRATGVHGRAPRAEGPERHNRTHGRPCLDARPAVRPTHGRAWWHGRACVGHGRAGCPVGAVRVFFRCFYSGFASFLGALSSPLLTLFESIFRIELGLGLG